MISLPRPLDFAIVGAAKSGTSSLSALLDRHPGVHIMKPKDGHYFCSITDSWPVWEGPRDDAFNAMMANAMSHYPTQLARIDECIKVGESSVFTMTNLAAMCALRRNLSTNGVVIIVLRRPDERAFSAYMHTVRDGLEHNGFERGLALEEQRRQSNWQPLWWYRSLGYYAAQVESTFDIFGRDRVRVITYDRLVSNTRAALEPIMEDLGLAWHPVELERNNTGGTPRSRALQDFLLAPSWVKSVGSRLLPRQKWLSLRRRIENANLRRGLIPHAAAVELCASYSSDIRRLEKATGLDLTAWRRPADEA